VFAQKSASGHVSDAGRYSVVFPQKPTKLEDDKPLSTTGGTLTIVTSRAESNGLVYSVTYADYPDAIRGVSPSVILDGVVNGMKGPDGEVSAKGELTGLSADTTGRAVTIVARENCVRAKVIYTGQRLYLVQVCGKKEAVQGKAADDFLASFAVRN
jgi:hypothetical protein